MAMLLGTTNQGGTGLFANYIYYARFICDTGGNCTSLKVYPLANTNVRLAIYSEKVSPRNMPDALLVESGSTAVTTGDWREVSVSSTALTQGVYYWLAYQTQAQGGTGYDLAAAQNEYEVYAYGAFPATATPTEQDAVLISLQGWGTTVSFIPRVTII